MDTRIHTAPPGTGVACLGRTLPSLMYQSVEQWGNAVTLAHQRDGKWVSLGLDDFRRRSERLAVGLLSLGLKRGDRVAFYMESDVGFCLADMACLIAGLVNVPIYLTLPDEAIAHVLDHSGARVLVVSTDEHADLLESVVSGRHFDAMIVAEPGGSPAVNAGTPRFGFAELEAVAEEVDRTALEELLSTIDPKDLATIIYTSGTTGVPKGVMLSHENLSYDSVTSFSGMPSYRRGPDGELGLSFLPLTHVFARALYYGFLETGTRTWFTTPDLISDAMKEIRPTIFAAVPRVIEKVYARFLERGALLGQPKRKIFEWALGLARKFKLGEEPEGFYRMQLRLADRLVYSKWREGLGGRVDYVISGGAALSAELANIFSAARIEILQGYGLTETSPVIAFNRPTMNRAGTVGVPIPGVEVKIAADGEILTRGPHVMLGYYRSPEKTREVIDAGGWFHTGDIGRFDEDGHLRITDRKKDLFKLSTGKYVMPQPLEHRLGAEVLIDHAVVTGSNKPYCTALIFPSESALRTLAETYGLPSDRPLKSYFEHPRVVGRFQKLVDKANQGIERWSTIKRFTLLDEPLTVEGGLLTPTMKVKRSLLSERFADVIEAMYSNHETVPEQD